MIWLVFVFLASFFDSSRIFIDNYSSDVYFKGKGAVSQKLFYGYMFVLIAIVISAISGFNFSSEYITNYVFFFISGLLGGIAGIPYYKALEIDDSTNIGIFTQLAPVLYLALGWFFLDQKFSPMQLVAFAVIISAPFLIIATTKKRSRKLKFRAVVYAFTYVLIAVIANLIFVKNNTDNLSIFIELAFLFLGKGISNIVIVYLTPKLRQRFKNVVKKSKKKVYKPLLANCIVGFSKDVFYRLGLITAPAVAIGSVASDSVEPIIIFFMGIVLTIIWPKFGREKLDKRSVFIHFLATILVVIGIVLLQF